MNWLLIEDDPNKSKQLLDFLKNKYPHSDIKIKRSYQSGLQAIFEEDYSLILLDMSLPTFDISANEDGYLHKQLAGQEILREMKRRKKDNKVIIVTQFDTFGEGDQTVSLESLKNKLSDLFPVNYFGTVFYKAGQTRWEKEIVHLLDLLKEND